MKLAKILEYVLLALSAILTVVFFVMPHDVASDPIVNIFIYFTYALLAVAAACTLIFWAKNTFSSKKGILNFLLLIVGVAVVVGGSYLLAPGGEVATSAEYTETISKLSDTIIFVVYFLVAGAILALVGTSVFNAIKNR